MVCYRLLNPNGLIEQWGRIAIPPSGQLSTVIFSVTYQNAPIATVSTNGTSDTDYGFVVLGHVITTVDSLKVDSNYGNPNAKCRLFWKSKGY